MSSATSRAVGSGDPQGPGGARASSPSGSSGSAGDPGGSGEPVRADDSVDSADSGYRPGTIMQGDRRKAYRPLTTDRRREALEAGLEAYGRGDFFEAHELLEPAWMGTSDLAERALYQGLIKLAAGYVHAVRGNPIGMARNLEGARKHLTTSIELDPRWGDRAGIDLKDLLFEVDVRLASVRSAVAHLATNPAAMLELAEAAPRLR